MTGFDLKAVVSFKLPGDTNYTILSKETGIDYVNNPEWLEREADAMTSAIWPWKRNNINKYADLDRIDSISDIINKGKITEQYGDANGFTDRNNKLKYYKTVFK